MQSGECQNVIWRVPSLLHCELPKVAWLKLASSSLIERRDGELKGGGGRSQWGEEGGDKGASPCMGWVVGSDAW